MNRIPQHWWKSIAPGTHSQSYLDQSLLPLCKKQGKKLQLETLQNKSSESSVVPTKAATLSSRYMRARGKPYRMRWQDSICVVPPPQTQTVKKTKSRVVENIIWRAYVAVSLMDRAKVIAPRRPGEHKQNDQHTCTQCVPGVPMSPWRSEI